MQRYRKQHTDEETSGPLANHLGRFLPVEYRKYPNLARVDVMRRDMGFTVIDTPSPRPAKWRRIPK